MGGVRVMDETYNASPEAVNATLDLLKGYSGRHFVVFGSMLELGENSFSLHRQVAQKMVDIALDGLVVLANGVERDVIKEVAGGIENFALAKDVPEAYRHLINWLKPGDNLLLKGSRKIGLEKPLAKLQQFYS